MKKVTNSILVGLACTSILSLSTGVQSVKADNQASSQTSQQLNYGLLEPFETYDNNGEFFDFKADNVVNGYVTDKTTTLSYKNNLPSSVVLSFFELETNNLIKLMPSASSTVALDNPLKAGHHYLVAYRVGNTIYPKFKFKVVSYKEVGAPTINKVTNQDTKITGTGVPGAMVHLNIAGDDYTGTVDASGKYNISLNRNYPVNSEIKLYQEKDGIKSDSVTAKVVALDHLEIPTINKVTSEDIFIIGTGVPGATVHIDIDGVSYTSPVDTFGNYALPMNRTYPVNTKIKLYQEKDGIKSDSVTATVVAPDHLETPIINRVTNLDTQVTGTGVPGATIHLNVAGDNYKGIVDNQGNYKISLNKMYPVNSTITLYQEKDGTKSDSVNLLVTKADGLAIPKINKVTDKDTTVTGIGLPGATVHLTISGQNFHTVASANGQFSINIEKAYPVNTPIEVYQELNGSRSETIEVYVELTSPFIVNKIKSNATAITGTGHPNAQITVRIDDEDFSGTIDGNGKFTIDLHGAKFAVGTDVTLKVVSSEGTETETVKIYPQDPVIGIVYAADDDIRGTTDPGATVFIIVGGEKYETVADSKGDFRQSVNPNLVVSGEVVTVYTSLNGLEGDKVTMVVN